MSKKGKENLDIAIIGMSCWYPGAQSLKTFWENILARRQQFRRLPDERLPLSEYHSPNKNTPDKTYGKEAAVLDGFEFDWQNKRIPKKVYDSTDIVHWLAVETALNAMRNAGLDPKDLEGSNSGVILGNTLTGEWTRTNAMRMRWPYIEKVIRQSAESRFSDETEIEGFLKEVEETYKSVFPAVTEDTLAGALSNTIAGRICNVLDLKGGGYTVDGACSSSLISIITAARNLSAGDIDLAFAGGIDVSLDTFELIGFAKTGALTPTEMRVYDKRANGFIPGEGCGFVVLKRMEDAIRDNDNIVAVINGCGISSDGKGGLTAPSIAGQANAISQAYEQAGYSLRDVDFVEGHGTGTKVGDQVEIGALAQVCGSEPLARKIGLTSLKSIVGHTKAAAGVGGLIKAAISVNQRVIPPMAGVSDPNILFSSDAKNFYPVRDGAELPADSIVRAGISAMGFGGINTHVTLSSHCPVDDRMSPEEDIKDLLGSYDTSELIVVSSYSQSSLHKKIEKLTSYINKISRAELLDLSKRLASEIEEDHCFRLSLIVQNPMQAYESLCKVGQALSKPMKAGASIVFSEEGCEAVVVNSPQAKRLGLIFPGQGSQTPEMAKGLIKRFAWARAMLSTADQITSSEFGFKLSEEIYKLENSSAIEDKTAINQSRIAQPAIALSSALWWQYLKRLGLKPAVVAGHSLGEISALYAAGTICFESLIRITAKRGELMNGSADNSGKMAYALASREQVEAVFKEIAGYIVIANGNAPRQVVVSGDSSSVEEFVEKCSGIKIRAGLLKVSNAFHSKYMDQASLEFEKFLAQFNFSEPVTKVLSGIDATDLSGIDIAKYLTRQMVSPVDFVAVCKQFEIDCDHGLEVGSGTVGVGIAQQNGLKKSMDLLDSVEPSSGDYSHAKRLIGRLFTLGYSVKVGQLFSNRFSRPFTDPAEREFIESPTERPLPALKQREAVVLKAKPISMDVATHDVTPVEKQSITEVEVMPEAVKPNSYLEELIQIVSELTEFDPKTLDGDQKLMDDLNLDSIKVTELLYNIQNRFEISEEIAPAAYANASLGELASQVEMMISQVGKGPKVAMAPSSAKTINANDGRKSTRKFAETIKADKKQPWVRSFSEVRVALERGPLKDLHSNPPSLVLLLRNKADSNFVDMNGTDLQIPGVQSIDVLEWSEIESQKDSIQGKTIVFCLENTDEMSGDESEVISSLIALSRVCSHAAAVALVQLDDGNFNRDASGETCLSMKSFARSIAEELPHKRVCGYSFDRTLSHEFVLNAVVSDMNAESLGQSVSYDAAKTRYESKLSLIDSLKESPVEVNWNDKDVVLVTGGAKGITAQCAFEFASNTRVRLALVGSSQYDVNDENSEVFQSLEKLRKAGLVAKYFQCDVLDAAAVAGMIDEVEAELGQVSAIIHGAGVNKAELAAAAKQENAEIQFKIKVDGLRNIIQASSTNELKAVYAITSIIGVMGMPGNSWYAFSNEALDLYLRRLATQLDGLETRSFAFSVWSEVGMGAKLGSAAVLESRGISSIAPALGVTHFNRALFNKQPDQQVCITSRMGKATSLPVRDETRSFNVNFTSEILHFHKDVEAITRTHLSAAEHPYLNEHNYKGSLLFPTVFGLEAMAQTANLICDIEGQLIISDINLTKPIVVSDLGLDIEIHAELIEGAESGRSIKVGIRTPLDQYREDHFSAVLNIDNDIDIIPSNRPAIPDVFNIDVAKTFYESGILFQGSEFQRLTEIEYLESDDETHGRTIFKSAAKIGDENGFLLGDPYARDSLLQSAQLIIPRNQCLPVHVEQIMIDLSEVPVNERSCFTQVRKTADKTYIGSVEVRSSTGAVVEQLSGYQLRWLSRNDSLPKATQLIKSAMSLPIVEDESVEAQALDVEVLQEQGQASDNSLLKPYHPVAGLLRIDAEPNGPQDQSVFVHRFIPDFKSFSNLTRSIYFSHLFHWMGWAREMSSIPVLDKVRELTETGKFGLVTNWAEVDYLGDCKNKHRLVEARMWCGELVGQHQSSAVLYFDWVSIDESGQHERIATGKMGFTWVEILGHGIVKPAPFPDYYKEFISTMVAKNHEPNTFIPADEPFRSLETGAEVFKAPLGPNTGLKLGSKIFDTGLYDSNLVGNLYFSNYSMWMGKLRDAHFQAIDPDLFKGIGELGEMTCRNTKIQHLREAMPFDQILVEMSLKAAYEKSFDLEFSFFKVCENGEREKLATASHEVIWTTVSEDGTRTDADLPEQIYNHLFAVVRKQSDKVAG